MRRVHPLPGRRQLQAANHILPERHLLLIVLRREHPKALSTILPLPPDIQVPAGKELPQSRVTQLTEHANQVLEHIPGRHAGLQAVLRFADQWERSKMAENKNIGMQTARLATAAVRIARGAATGGVHGAAVEAVLAFLPEILKAIGMILLFFILLPSFVFFCFPNSVFQYDSVTDHTVSEMSSESIRVSNIYKQTIPIIQEKAEKWADRHDGGFDDMRISYELSGMDEYWMAAIFSARYWQETDEITEKELEKVIDKGISYDTDTEYYYVNEKGEEVVPESDAELLELQRRTRIVIIVEFKKAESLMKSLKMDEFQRDWAVYLHDNIADSQLQEDDFEQIDFGDVEFTDSVIPVTYFNQQDERWASQPYSASTIGVAGCGPTAMAMVVSSLTGNKTTPSEMAQWAEENGQACYGNGSYHSIVPAAAQAYGLHVENAGMPTAQKLADALRDGKLVVVIMGPGTFTTGGHFIVLRGVSRGGKVRIADPVSIDKSHKTWDLSLILNEAKTSAAAGGPFWIISK